MFECICKDKKLAIIYLEQGGRWLRDREEWEVELLFTKYHLYLHFMQIKIF